MNESNIEHLLVVLPFFLYIRVVVVVPPLLLLPLVLLLFPGVTPKWLIYVVGRLMIVGGEEPILLYSIAFEKQGQH